MLYSVICEECHDTYEFIPFLTIDQETCMWCVFQSGAVYSGEWIFLGHNDVRGYDYIPDDILEHDHDHIYR